METSGTTPRPINVPLGNLIGEWPRSLLVSATEDRRLGGGGLNIVVAIRHFAIFSGHGVALLRIVFPHWHAQQSR